MIRSQCVSTAMLNGSMTTDNELEQATRIRDGGGGTIEVEIERLEEEL